MSNPQPAKIELQGGNLDSTALETTELPEVKSSSVASVGIVDAETAKGAQTPASPRTVHGISWFLMTFSMLSTVFLYALDNTITADLIPVVASVFRESNKLVWLSVGFMIGGVVTVLPFGKLYGLFNAKSLYMISITLFMIGSALCGAAPSINAFIVGRVIAGVGGNGMYLGAQTLLSVNTSDTERPMYLGVLGLTFCIGMVIGPVIGGAFAQSHATWRWGFYLNLCVCACFAPVYIFILPGFDPRKTQKFWSRFREFDYLGAVLSIGTLVCIIMAINFGGTLYAWNSGQIISLLVLSGGLAVAFGFAQVWPFEAAHRMFPVEFLKNKEAVLLFILMAVCNGGGFTPIYYIPAYFQFTQGDSALRSAVRLLPLIVMVSITILVNGAVLSKGGYYKPWYIGGSCLGLVGTVLLSTITVNMSTAKIYGYEILVGIGAGSYAQAGYAIIQTTVEPSMMAYGITFMMLAQLVGVAMGLSIAGAVFVNIAFKNLQQVVPGITTAQLESAILGTSGSFLETLSPNIRAAALEAIVAAMRKLLVLPYVAFAVGLIASVFLSRRKLQAA